MASGTVTYLLRATGLPRTLSDGLLLESALPPCNTPEEGADPPTCQQYYVMPVSGYDIVRVQLTRTGNITFDDGSPRASIFKSCAHTILAGRPAVRVHKPYPSARDEAPAFQQEHACSLPSALVLHSASTFALLQPRNVPKQLSTSQSANLVSLLLAGPATALLAGCILPGLDSFLRYLQMFSTSGKSSTTQLTPPLLSTSAQFLNRYRRSIRTRPCICTQAHLVR